MTFFSWHESESISRSVLSDSLRPHGLWPTSFLCPWNSPGKNTGVVAISFSRGSLQTEPQGQPFFSWQCSIIVSICTKFQSKVDEHQETVIFQRCFALNLGSVQFSCSVVSDSLRPHESKHARPPCPSPTPGVH